MRRGGGRERKTDLDFTARGSRRSPPALRSASTMRWPSKQAARGGGAGGHRLVGRRELGRAVGTGGARMKPATSRSATSCWSARRNCYVRSDGMVAAVVGLEDAVVVVTEDAVLAMHRDCAQDVKTVVDRLKAAGRHEARCTQSCVSTVGVLRESDPGRPLPSEAHRGLAGRQAVVAEAFSSCRALGGGGTAARW